MFCHFRYKTSVCGNRCHTLIIKDRQSEKIGIRKIECATQLLSLSFEILKLLGIWIFFQHFYFCKKSLKISKFSKNGIYVLEQPLKNVYTKFQVIPSINVVFIAF